MKAHIEIYGRSFGEADTPEEMYALLTSPEFKERQFPATDLLECMELIQPVYNQYYKPRFLLDHTARRAFEFMDDGLRIATLSPSDIDWKTLKFLPGHIRERAQCMDGYYPTLIHAYRRGLAEVRWELQPARMYYVDEDGYGMTDDEVIALHGRIDRTGRAVGKFRYRPE